MGTARKLTIILSNLVLIISIVLFVGSFTLVGTISNKQQTTRIISESGLYDTIAQNARNQLIESTPLVSQIPGNIVNNAVSRAINEQSVKKMGEPVIDRFYDWLESNTESPEVKIDLKPIQVTFVDSIAEQLLARATQLPQCLPGQIPNTIDIASIDCIPSEYSIKPVIAQIKKSLTNANTDSFNVFSSEQLTNPEQTQNSPLQTLKKIRGYYQTTKTVSVVALISAGFAIILIIVCSASSQIATKNLGIIFIILGAFYTLSGVIIPTASQATLKTLSGQLADNNYKLPVQKILKDVTTIGSNYILKCGLVLLLTGLLLLIACKILHKKNVSVSQNTAQGNNN